MMKEDNQRRHVMCYDANGHKCRKTLFTIFSFRKAGRISGLFCFYRLMSNSNPRYRNGNLRRKYRQRFKAMDAPCGICRGKLGPIRYDEPSDAAHPLSFVIDEIKPVSKWRQFGYASPAAAAQDWDNLQAAHYCCNQMKGAKTSYSIPQKMKAPAPHEILLDGHW